MSDQVTPPGHMSHRKRVVRWTLFVLGGLFALAILLVLFVRFAAQSGFGRNFVEARIEAADPSGQDIEVEGLSGDLFGKFTIERLTVADENGIWLIAENVVADWKPLALRNRALRVDALEADLIHVLRRPILVPSDRPPSEGGSMPIRTGEIELLRIGELRTDEGVLPRALSLQIDGQGRLGRDGGRTQLEVSPLDGEGDLLNADLTWSDDFRVKGDLVLEGPSGGLFASLARLDDGQSISARLVAGGTLDEWEADLDADIDSEDAIGLEASANGDIISFRTTLHPARHPLTARIADTLGETLDIRGDIDTAGERPVLDISADAEGLQLSARAERNETGAYAADLRLTADNPSRYIESDSVSIGQATLDGTLVYQDGAVRYDGTVNASQVELPSFSAQSVSGPLTATYEARQISVRTTLTGERAVLPGMASKIAGPAPVVQANATYDMQSKALSLRETTIRGRGGRIAGAGTLSFSPLAADIAGSFQIDGAAAGLARPIKANGQFQANRAGNGATRFNTRVNASNLGELPSILDDWAGDQALMTANGELLSDGALRLSSFTAETGSLRLNGAGRLSSGQVVSASADITAGEGSASGFDLSGLDGHADISGPLDNLDFTARITAPNVSRGDLSFSDVDLGADGNYGDGAVLANTTLTAQTSNGPLLLSTGIAAEGAAWQLTDLQGEWGDLIAEGDVGGNGGDLAALRGDIVLRGDLPDGLPASSIDAAANIQGDTLTVDTTFEDVAFGPTRADALVIRANGTLEDANFVIDMDGRTELNGFTHETALDIDGSIQGLTSGMPDLTASLSMLLGEVGVTTQQPIRYVSYEDGFEVTAELAALGGSLRPNITTRGETQIRLQGEGLRIAPLLILSARPGLEGAMDIDINFTETPGGGLAGPLRAELTSVARPGSDLAPVDLFITGDLQPDLLDLQVRALDNQALEANAKFSVPVSTSPALPFISLVPGSQVPFTAQADGQIEAIAALVVPPQMLLQGVVDIDLSGSLPTLDETFEGEFRFSEGVFEHGGLGMVLNRISADASLGSGMVTLRSLSARGRSGGTLTGNGSMAIDGSGRSDLELEARRLVVTERREGSATVSGTMQLNQQPDLLEVTGDLTVDEGTIHIDRLPQGGPPTLDVSFGQPEEEEEEKEAATRLDIDLTAPGQIDVRGRGANAELSLDAHIGGTIGEPVITGEANIVRGRFDLIGKRFAFGDSSVRLAQDIKDSRLSISAVHETNDDISAILNVTGTVDRPEIELTSEPVLPEDEVLSRVLFGRSPSQLTTLETARLAAALAQLSGGGGFDLLGGIEQALGLDTFDVGSGAGGDVQVTSGKYLTENVYLEVRSGAAGAPGIAIEWEPIENIEIEAATNTGEDQGQQLSIQWKKDFDDPGSKKED